MVCDKMMTAVPKSCLNLPIFSKEEEFMNKLDSSLFISLGIERNAEPMTDFNLTPSLKPLDLSATPELDTEKDIPEENEEDTTTLKPCNLISPLDNEAETTLSPPTSNSESDDDSQKDITMEDDDELRAAECFLLRSSSFRLETPLFTNQGPVPHRNHILDLVNSLDVFKTQSVPAEKNLDSVEIEDNNVPIESDDYESPKKPAKRKRMSLLASMKKKSKLSGTYLAPKMDEKNKEIYEFTKPKELRHCDYCTKKFTDLTMFLKHLRTHKDPRLRCAKCGVQKSHIIYKRSHEVRCFKRDAIIRYYCMKNSKNGIVDPFAGDDCEPVTPNEEW